MNTSLIDNLLGENEVASSIIDLVKRFHYEAFPISTGIEGCSQNFEKNECYNTTTVSYESQNCCMENYPDLKELLFAMRESIQPTKFFSDESEIGKRKNMITKSKFENILDQPELLEDMIAHNFDAKIVSVQIFCTNF